MIAIEPLNEDILKVRKIQKIMGLLMDVVAI